MSLYDFPCEYCSGTVRERIVDREPITLHCGIIILENALIGICDNCGAHYYAAPVLKQAETILKSAPKGQKTIEIPIQPFAA